MLFYLGGGPVGAMTMVSLHMGEHSILSVCVCPSPSSFGTFPAISGPSSYFIGPLGCFQFPLFPLFPLKFPLKPSQLPPRPFQLFLRSPQFLPRPSLLPLVTIQLHLTQGFLSRLKSPPCYLLGNR